MSRVVLVGPRGAGKTALGTGLAETLGWTFLDTDALLEARGRTVGEIFAAEGEKGFRRLEREVIATLEPPPGAVVATGGGAVLDPTNRSRLAALGPVIYLRAPAELLAARVAGSDRPALTGWDLLTETRHLLATREPLYLELATAVLDTGSLDLPGATAALVALARSLAEGAP